jgi:hypothetical protein
VQLFDERMDLFFDLFVIDHGVEAFGLFQGFSRRDQVEFRGGRRRGLAPVGPGFEPTIQD